MSLKAMTWAWSQRVGPGEKLVLAALADHADDNGVAWPGLRGIALKCGLSHRMVQRYVSRLVSQGLLQRLERYRADNSRTSDIFQLPIGVIIDTTPMTDMSPPHDTGVIPPMTVASPPHDSGVTPGTIIEPSLEPSLREPPISPFKGDAQRQQRKRRSPTLTILTGLELLNLFDESEKLEIEQRFPGVGLEWEAGKCVEWHNARSGSGNWKLALKNWLDNWQKNLERSKNNRNAQPGRRTERAGARFDNSDAKYRELAKHDIG